MKRARGNCAGQALVESLVAMLALAVLWVGLNWLGQYQDMALSASHASRHAAFIATRLDAGSQHGASAGPAGPASEAGPVAAVPVRIGSPLHGYFSGAAHRWKDRRGVALLDADAGVQAQWRRLPPLALLAQPGGASIDAETLRREWSLDDRGIVQASVALGFTPVAPAVSAGGLLKLAAFDDPYPPIRRRNHILTGAGHAASDADTQRRVAASPLAWATAASHSQAAGATVAGRAEGVDDAWHRDSPTFDWLQRWSGYVPAHLVQDYTWSPHEPARLAE